jgi:hypothetical protein
MSEASDDFDFVVLVSDFLTGSDFTPLASFDDAIDHYFTKTDDVLGLSATLNHVRDLHQITKRNKLCVFKLEFFHGRYPASKLTYWVEVFWGLVTLTQEDILVKPRRIEGKIHTEEFP